MADISISVDITGLEELQRFLTEDVYDALTENVQDSLKDLRDEIDNTTTTLVPVRTGALRDSIDISVSDYNLTAEAGMDYASYVDQGTSRQDAEPYFDEPIREAFDQWEADLDNMIQSAIEDGDRG